jgi:hypothetical protein
MLRSLPEEILRVFDRFVTTEYVTMADGGQPIAWPVTPYVDGAGRCLDVSTGLGYPKKARDAERNPRVALLFSDPTGSGLDSTPMVLVQGTARVDDTDLDANRARYERESLAKLPATKSTLPPKPVRRFFLWYFARIYVHVRPERVFAWPGGDVTADPEMFLADVAEVRSGHSEAPRVEHHAPEGGATAWDPRLDDITEAVIAVESPDGWPFAVRVPVRGDAAARLVRVLADPVGAPFQPGLACLTAHSHAPDFSWQRNFQARGDLVEDDDGWVFLPHKIVGGFELPPTSTLDRYKLNWSKIRRFRRTARHEMEARR